MQNITYCKLPCVSFIQVIVYMHFSMRSASYESFCLEDKFKGKAVTIAPAFVLLGDCKTILKYK